MQLLNKFIFGRKRGGVPVGNHGSKSLEELLKKKVEQAAKEEPPAPKKTEKDSRTIIREMTFKRRKDLFLDEGREWSSQVRGLLEKKTKMWERMKHAKMLAMLAKKEEEERCNQQSSQEVLGEDSNGGGGGGGLRQHLSSPPITMASQASYHSSLLQQSPSYVAGMNPYLLSQVTASSMLYPNLLSTYPLLTTLPINSFPYLLPTGQAAPAGMLLMPNSGGVALAPSSPSSTTLRRGSSPSPSSVTGTRSQSPTSPQRAGMKQASPSPQQSYPGISSLLQSSKPISSPPPAKKHRRSPTKTASEKTLSNGM